MAFKNSGQSTTPPPPPRAEVEEEVKQEEGRVLKTISLKFPSGYVFTISVENNKMTVESKLRDKQAFLLDEIPESFIRDLRNMLQE
jgi:hypothetical protein